MEWLEDYDETDIGHRHISQLFALYPADLINPYKTPKLADAARAALVRRLINGGSHMGYSCAWVTNMWARLFDGIMVSENLKRMISHYCNPNLTDSKPPFQIEGNFGAAAAIAEALMQSCGGEINLLPALPEEWTNGHIKGLRAKGGFTVDIYWAESRLCYADITSDLGGELRLRANAAVSVSCGGEAVDSVTEDGIIIINTEEGKTYNIKA
jgi:alpha-L-fucosidase 2